MTNCSYFYLPNGNIRACFFIGQESLLILFLAVSDEKPLSKEESSLLTKVLRAKLVESTKEVEVQRKDPKSPLYSVKSFEELQLYVVCFHDYSICSIRF